MEKFDLNKAAIEKELYFRKSWKKEIFWKIVALFFMIFLFLFLWMNRWEYLDQPEGRRVNKITGVVQWHFKGGGWVTVTPEKTN
ncbi:MAG: hypothetical protein PHH18_09260 [Acidobacteriota bacterium]|nr:hypothetical protein [Acidobacteriota bacterium]